MRQVKAEETRDRVIAAARMLFASKGFFATSTTEIVETAGLPSRGSRYQHFETKELLFAEVLERVETDLSLKVSSRVVEGTWFERLRQGLSLFLDASLEVEVRQILLIDGPAVLGWDAWRDVEARFGLGAIVRMLESGISDGSIVVANPVAMAHLLLSVVDEAALFIANAEDPDLARRSAGDSVSALLSGLQGSTS